MLFNQKPDFKCLWEGNLSLKQIKWGKKLDLEYTLSEFQKPLIEKHWKHHLEKFPEDYDGKLLYLFNYHFRGNKLILDLGYIRFSTVIFMVSNGIKVDSGIGMLGMQSLIFSPKNRYILVGERLPHVSYYPGYTTIPGGMLEINDLKLNPEKAFVREINEEVKLELDNEAFLISILNGWNGVSVTFVLKTKVKEDYPFDPKESIFAEKEEWQNKLNWISLEQIKKYDKTKLLDGLIYFQSKLKSSRNLN